MQFVISKVLAFTIVPSHSIVVFSIVTVIIAASSLHFPALSFPPEEGDCPKSRILLHPFGLVGIVHRDARDCPQR